MAKSNRVNAESPVQRPTIQNQININEKYKKIKLRYKTIFVYNNLTI